MRFFYFISILILLFVNYALASAKYVTNSFDDFYDIALHQGVKYGSSNVLLVFDIDNTLLTSRHALGSQAWYKWQVSLLHNNPNSSYLVAKDLMGLSRVETLLYQLNALNLTEPIIPGLIHDLKRLSFKMMVLSGRWPNEFDATLRNLDIYGLHFKYNTIGPIGGFAQRYYLPNLSADKDIYFKDGILLGHDINKGSLLKDLLHRTGANIKAIVFIDDELKNIDDMYAAFAHTNIDITAIRYTRIDKELRQFNKAAKMKCVAQWKQLYNTMAEVVK